MYFIFIIIIIILFSWYGQSKFKQGGIQSDYPYITGIISELVLRECFARVVNYRLKIVNAQYNIFSIRNCPNSIMLYNGKKSLIKCSPDDYFNMNWISDYFNENCRVRAKRYDEEYSPYNFWLKNKAKIAKIPDLNEQREFIYKNIRGCNNFRPSLMSGFIKLLNAKSVLDFSSGWGDRLLGAIANDVRYVGVDPNPCVHKGYSKMIDMFAKDSTKYTMICAPFQTAKLPNEYFDLVFTSPPYFDLEIYTETQDDNQSINEFTNLDSWFEKFLMFSLQKCWKSLNARGHMIIIINNIRDKPDFVLKMIKRVTFSGAQYKGLLSYADYSKGKYKSPQPMWIWYKQPIFLFSDRANTIKTTMNEFRNLVKSEITEISEIGEFSNIADRSVAICKTKIDIDSVVDSVVYGSVLVDNILYYVWKRETFNPNPPITTSLKDGFTIVREDLLPGGTKQRAHKIIADFTEDEIVYAGPWNGFAQVALAIACKLHSKRATVFCTRDDSSANIRAKNYNCNIVVIPDIKLKTLQQYAEDYAKVRNAKLMPFGFDNAEFRNELYLQLTLACKDVIDVNTTATIWVVAGSGTLLNVLYKVFPKARFAAVQVGKTIWEDQIESDRTTIYIAPQKFYDIPDLLPGYNSVPTYDAKVWQFASKYGKSGDIIWNVAG